MNIIMYYLQQKRSNIKVAFKAFATRAKNINIHFDTRKNLGISLKKMCQVYFMKKHTMEMMFFIFICINEYKNTKITEAGS